MAQYNYKAMDKNGKAKKGSIEAINLDKAKEKLKSEGLIVQDIKEQGAGKKELVKTLNETLTAKKNGAKCIICGAPIWAAGNLCFTCTTGEANDSDDYEIE